MAPLDVWFGRRLAGHLERLDGGDIEFAYEREWIASEGPPLSHSLPIREGPLPPVPAATFFSNLLPEGDLRTAVARAVGVSATNDFALLEAIGGDCAGAVALLPPGTGPPPETEDDVRWLDDDELADTVAELPRRPFLADEDDVRLSLAGAQDKLPVVVAEGRVGIPLANTPSTHIIKAPIVRLEGTVANELFCLSLARSMGMSAAEASSLRVAGEDVLLVRRYDRVVDETATTGTHQEDFCQALAVPPGQKYEADGGPTVEDCASLLRAASTRPAADLLAFVDAITFNLLVGNHNAHAKNYSLLYSPTGTALAPLYDLLSTAIYPGLSRKLAMKLGGEYRPDYIRRRHLERFARAAELGAAAVRHRMLSTTRAIGDVVEDVAADFRARGEEDEVHRRIVELVNRRAAALAEEARATVREPGA